VLRICEEDVYDIMFRLPPKFALGLLKSLIRVLPAPTQTGGSHTLRSKSFVGAAQEAPNNAEQPTNVDTLLAQGGSAAASAGNNDAAGCPEVPAELVFLARQHGLTQQAQSTDENSTRDSSDQDGEDEEYSGSEETKVLAAEPGVVYGPTPGGASRGQHTTFSMLEKLVLLQGVKIFRCVSNEYLPWLAACCCPVFFHAGTELFREGEPTNAKLYIVAEGTIGLYSNTVGPRPTPERQAKMQLTRRLQVGDSMGNTGLLLDHDWHYTAAADEDTWALCISRSDLTDLLRGRRELAAAVIRGLYRSFTRRMQQVSDLEVRSREWLIAADYSRIVESPPDSVKFFVDPLAFSSPPPALALPPSRHTMEEFKLDGAP